MEENTEKPAPLPAEGPGRLARLVKIHIPAQGKIQQCQAGEHHLSPGDQVVVQTPGGKFLGTVKSFPVHFAVAASSLPPILRKASPDEIAKDGENRAMEQEAKDHCASRIRDMNLPMKLLKVEFCLDRSRAVFYFTSEKRVDFRELVRDLAKKYHSRIEMRQVGIRDETGLMGGLGPCGMAFCCCSFLKEFAPISVKMAKEQNVILNPTKISGGCGRLLCCLHYEHATYQELMKDLPKIGKKVDLAEGKARVRGVDIFRRTVTLEMPDGKIATLTVEELKGKMK